MLCALVIVFAFASNAIDFPAAPLPMYELWRRSDIVVFADVISTKSDNGKQISIISIAKVLKGDQVKAPTSMSIFTSLGGCPYPHHFKATERVIVFLHFDSDELMYTPVGAAEAAFIADSASVKDYQSFFDELPKVFSVPDEIARNEQLLRWSVRCTLNSSTRSQGLMSLNWIRPKNTKVGDWLLPAEANGLLDIILTQESPDQVLGLIDLVDELPDQKLDNLLISCLSKCHEEGWSETARHALQKLPARLQIELSATLDEQLDDFLRLESDFYYGDAKPSKKLKKRLKTTLDTRFGWLCSQAWSEITHETALRTKR
jgi:hypothetical protein